MKEIQEILLKELDLLYRLRFERGLTPTPEKFKTGSIRALAAEIENASNTLEKLDDFLKEWHEKAKEEIL